jgi:predicted transcriptional regulator
MIIKRGFLEILEIANGNEPKHFDDFTKIAVTRRLSSATISKRLDELVKVKALEEMVIRSEHGKRIIGYKTTDKGKKVIEMAKKLQDAVAVSISE